MKDKRLYKICLIFSLISIILLLVFSYLKKPEEVAISSIDNGDVGKEVSIRGRVKDSYLSKEGHFFFHVKGKNGGKINAVIFKKGFEEMELSPSSLQEGQEIRIRGEIGTHDRELQILPDEIIL